ncbi:MAG: hypothetical protein ACRD6X_00780 [Pyrinomonadaceae bacterium]
MKLQHLKLRIILLIVVLLLSFAHKNVNAAETRIKGKIVGYMWDSLWLVRTTKNEYVVLRHRTTFPTNPVPESGSFDFNHYNFVVETSIRPRKANLQHRQFLYRIRG